MIDENHIDTRSFAAGSINFTEKITAIDFNLRGKILELDIFETITTYICIRENRLLCE
jgi:hypothetical protein